MANDGWQTASLGSIARTNYGLVDGPFGSNLPASEYTDSGVPVIRGSNLSLGQERFNGNEFVFVSEETASRLSRSLCEPNDIIFTKKGTLGQTGIVPKRSHFKKFLLSSNQMKLSVDPAKADPLFVYYVVSSPSSRSKIIQDSTVTGVPKTNLAYLRDFPILLPTLAEQKAIAHVLSTLDDKIELNRRMNETLEDMARALFKSWFVDFDPVRAKAEGSVPAVPKAVADLFPGDLVRTEVGDLPQGWQLKPIGELATVSGGSTPSTKEPSYWEGGTHHWATPKDLSTLKTPVLVDTDRKITNAGVTQISSGLLPQGTVLMSSRAPIGYLAIAEVPVAINQGFIAMQPAAGVSNLFLLRWAEWAHDTIVSRANGSTFLEISKSNFRPILVALPPEPLMKEFEHIARPLYRRMVLNEQTTRTLAALRDSLLPKLVSGEIRIPDAERIVEGRS